MKIYFTFRNIPEMANIPEPDRSKVWRSFLKDRGYFNWASFAALLPFFPILYSGEFGIQQINLWLNIPIGVHVALFTFVAFLGAFVLSVIYVSLMRKPFRQYLLGGRGQGGSDQT